MKNYTEFYFFYKTRHPFSNWHRSPFTDEDGIDYNCSEQYMMYKKAMLFGDSYIAKKILTKSDPRDQKDLGRMVANFDTKKWSDNAKKIVYEGLKLKFDQNPDLKKVLMQTSGKLLVEASPYDKVWGIGLAEDNPKIYDRNNWRGENWLGIVLTELREFYENND